VSPAAPAPFRKLLACVAEGTLSDNAVRMAADLAERTGAELDLVHATAPIHAGLELASDSAGALSAARAERVRETLRAHLSHRHAGVTVAGRTLADRLEVAIGSPPRVVLERVAERGHDVVFLGDSGKRKQLDVGGLARALYTRAHCPIWLQVAPPRGIERVLAPIDLSPSSAPTLARAVEIARPWGARVTALHCFLPPDPFTLPGDAARPIPYTIDAVRRSEREAFEDFVSGFEWRGVDHSAEFVEDEPARTVLAFQERYDLIVLGTHGRGALMSALLGGVAWQVVRLAHTAVVTVRDLKREYSF
jgi:nucleotide-binding universal stress UspA family protein